MDKAQSWNLSTPHPIIEKDEVMQEWCFKFYLKMLAPFLSLTHMGNIPTYMAALCTCNILNTTHIQKHSFPFPFSFPQSQLQG
jgi:hypothetical protein